MEQIPLEIGPYQIKEEIGRGGMAVVYRATDTRVSRDVALKVLLPQHSGDPSFLKRFIREGQASENLCHDNIVRTYEAGQGDGHYYMAMQLVKGGTLLDYVQRRNQLLPPDEVISILSQVGAGLDYAHSLGFLHRDIKLSNVLMMEDGTALLSDFGVVKFMDGDHSMHTMVGHTVGTPSFMAPEQARGEDINARADVYSLGVIAYTLFTGRLPFSSDNQPQLMYKIVHETPVSPDAINPDIPEGVVPAINKVLSKNPDKRYGSAGEFVAALVSGRMYGRRTEQPVIQSMTKEQHTQLLTRLSEEARWEGGFALGWALNLAVAVGLLWFVLSPFLQLDDRFAAAFRGDVRSAQFIETGAIVSSMRRFSASGSQFNFGTIRDWWRNQESHARNFDFDQTMSEMRARFEPDPSAKASGPKNFTVEGIMEWLGESMTQMGDDFSKRSEGLGKWTEQTWKDVQKGIKEMETPDVLKGIIGE